MSQKHGHHDRGPPATTEAMVEDEIVVGADLVIADPGLVVVGEDAVVVGPDEVAIEPEDILLRCDLPSRRRRQRPKCAVSKGSPKRPR